MPKVNLFLLTIYSCIVKLLYTVVCFKNIPMNIPVEIHLIPMDPVALTLKVEQKVALTGLTGLAR